MIIHACSRCGGAFSPDSDEDAFLRRISPRIGDRILEIAPPRLCPNCRFRRRLAFRNHSYVSNQQDTQSGELIFTMYPGGAPFPLLRNDVWWGDGWDALVFGRDFDFERSFFTQWRELQCAVPHPALSTLNMQNSDFCNNASGLKNCYFVFNSNNSQDCMYCETCWDCTDCIECTAVYNCELCHDCVNCRRCYLLQSSEHCSDCSESFFLSRCRSCTNCYGCANLTRATYCIFNRQVTRAEYESFISGKALSAFSIRSREAAAARKFWCSAPFPHLFAERIDECSGDYLYNAKQVTDSFMIKDAEALRRCYALYDGSKDCRDVTLFGMDFELGYECTVCGYHCQRMAFCHDTWDGCSDLMYCDMCPGCSDCFGCVGLRKKRYCVLNKQYGRAEYEQLISRIAAHMRRTGEWGEFFPIELSPIPYNLSLAQRYFPSSRDDCEQEGLRWYEPISAAGSGIDAAALPDRDEPPFGARLVRSSASGKLFKITAIEAERLAARNAPLPRTTYDERFAERAEAIGQPFFAERPCDRSDRRVLSRHGRECGYPVWAKELYDAQFA